jgi:hypothetical protein
MVERDPSLPTGFSIYQELDKGIYECEPKGVRHLENNYPYWIIASLDLKEIKDLKEGDLVNVSDFSLIKEENYYTATANGRPIIAIPATRIDIESEDEYESIGVPVPRTEPTSERERDDVVRRVKELVRRVEEYFKTPTRKTRKSDNQARIYTRSDRSDRSRSPNREKLFSSPHYRDSPKKQTSEISATIPLFKKKKKSLRKSNKNSLRKSKNKSKTSIKCKKTPYAWKSSSIKKSPFRKLERAKDAERQYKAGKSIGFTAISSLKSLGRIPRSDGCYALGAKYSTLKRH